MKKEDTLQGDVASVDVATEENLKKLVEVGNELLEKQVSSMDLDTGLYQPVEGAGTNKETLKRLII